MTKPIPANNKVSEPPVVHQDGTQDGTGCLSGAPGILRGVQRLLAAHAIANMAEVVLANGRRAGVMGLSPTGGIWIVEIKSSIADVRADQKWPVYRDYCDRLWFAVEPDFPVGILPADTGLILAGRFGGEIVREAPEIRLAPARRKAVTLAFAHVAAERLSAVGE